MQAPTPPLEKRADVAAAPMSMRVATCASSTTGLLRVDVREHGSTPLKPPPLTKASILPRSNFSTARSSTLGDGLVAGLETSKMVLPPYGFHVQCSPGHDKIVVPDLQAAIPA
jgi:hypothetical protein